MFQLSSVHSQQNKSLPKISISSRVKFYKEIIEIECYENEHVVHGKYFFENLTDSYLTMTIKYPFPVDENHPFPHEIDVKNYFYRKDSTSIYFIFKMLPYEKKFFEVIYKQKHFDNSVTYILTSTHAWGKAIEEAEYFITVPNSWKNLSLSYHPTKTVEQKNNKIQYYILKKDFFPENNLFISWKK